MNEHSTDIITLKVIYTVLPGSDLWVILNKYSIVQLIYKLSAVEKWKAGKTVVQLGCQMNDIHNLLYCTITGS